MVSLSPNFFFAASTLISIAAPDTDFTSSGSKGVVLHLPQAIFAKARKDPPASTSALFCQDLRPFVKVARIASAKAPGRRRLEGGHLPGEQRPAPPCTNEFLPCAGFELEDLFRLSWPSCRWCALHLWLLLLAPWCGCPTPPGIQLRILGSVSPGRLGLLWVSGLDWLCLPSELEPVSLSSSVRLPLQPNLWSSLATRLLS
jgi:hypothetical protein